MKSLSQRLDHLNSHFFSNLNERITRLKAEGIDIIRLDAGSPDLPPAPHIIEALSRSAASPGNHSYQPYNGTRELREAWAAAYHRSFQVVLDPELQVLPLIGSKEGIFYMTLAMIEAGDMSLVPDPGYMTYVRSTRLAGGKPFRIPLLPECEFLPDFSSLPAGVLNKAKIMWLNYPNNPTSATATLDFFAEAVDFAHRHDILLCHDAAYAQITFDGYLAPSLLQVPGAKEVAVEFNSLSKWYNMAGWRLGAALGSQLALSALYQVKVNTDNGHFRPILDAATAALAGDQIWLVERNAIYQQRRDLIFRALQMTGIKAWLPKASFYIWFAIPAGWTSEGFTRMLLEKAHVSLVPGTIFGENGQGFVRLSFTAPMERLSEAMSRISSVLE